MDHMILKIVPPIRGEGNDVLLLILTNYYCEHIVNICLCYPSVVLHLSAANVSKSVLMFTINKVSGRLLYFLFNIDLCP